MSFRDVLNASRAEQAPTTAYDEWRQTEEGAAVWSFLVREACLWVAGGATRLNAAALVRTVEAQYGTLNHAIRFGLVRELGAIPTFDGMMEPE